MRASFNQGRRTLDPQEVGPQVGVWPQELGGVPPVGLDPVGREGLGEVELSGAKGPLLSVDRVDRVEMDGREPHVRGVPVGGGLFATITWPRRQDSRLKGPLPTHFPGTAEGVAAPVRDPSVFHQGGKVHGQPGRARKGE